MTFANLPESVTEAITNILQQQDTREWVKRAQGLHDRYVRGKTDAKAFIQDFEDALAYVALRSPATYAQTVGAFEAISELIPTWQPKSLLDLGSGPGTATWAATTIWPKLTEIACLDQDSNFLSLGKQINENAALAKSIHWQKHDFHTGIDSLEKSYDLVVIANVLNELTPSLQEKLIGQAWNACDGVLVIIEPGTPGGSQIVSSVAQKLRNVATLLAPYIENSFVMKSDYYLHFPQRFIRPEFQRVIRQHMRDDDARASDWEDAKYSYVAISKIPMQKKVLGRCVGPITMQKGFLEVPVLTAETITKVKVMKRNKEDYTIAKHLKWGDTLSSSLIN